MKQTPGLTKLKTRKKHTPGLTKRKLQVRQGRNILQVRQGRIILEVDKENNWIEKGDTLGSSK